MLWINLCKSKNFILKIKGIEMCLIPISREFALIISKYNYKLLSISEKDDLQVLNKSR